MSEQNVLLEMKNISKDFSGIHAVSDFSMKVCQGELRCLIGPNGAGKTTIFKMLMGIYPPSFGRILLAGEDITRLPSEMKVKKGLSIKMQVPGVFHNLTVWENIRIAAQNYNKKSDLYNEINRLMELIKISNLADEPVRNLSHGQQQWVEIAMALATHPKILLLDEPAAGLGPEETDMAAELIRRLNETGLTIIFIEHDMDFVRKTAQKVTVLYNGRFFKEGSIEEIQEDQEVIDIYLGNS